MLINDIAGPTPDNDETLVKICGTPESIAVDVNPLNVIYLIDSDSETEQKGNVKRKQTDGRDGEAEAQVEQRKVRFTVV